MYPGLASNSGDSSCLSLLSTYKYEPPLETSAVLSIAQSYDLESQERWDTPSTQEVEGGDRKLRDSLFRLRGKFEILFQNKKCVPEHNRHLIIIIIIILGGVSLCSLGWTRT